MSDLVNENDIPYNPVSSSLGLSKEQFDKLSNLTAELITLAVVCEALNFCVALTKVGIKKCEQIEEHADEDY